MVLIQSIQCFAYEIPFARPCYLGKTWMENRKGIYIQAHLQDGRDVFAEIAPLPGVSKEILSQVKEQLRNLLPYLHSSPSHPLEWLYFLEQNLGHELLPSVAMGLESLANAILFPNHETISLPLTRLAIDGEEIRQPNATCKIKLRGCNPGQARLKILETLKKIDPQTKLRVDCNRAYSLEEALEIFSPIPPESLDYIEEPTQAFAEFVAFSKQLKHHLAVDESLDDCDIEDLQNIQNLKALIIKPSLLGGWYRLEKLSHIFNPFKYQWILTGSFESSVGVHQAARLFTLHNLPIHSAGLDTYRYLDKEIVSPTVYEEQGRIIISPIQSINTTYLLPL